MSIQPTTNNIRENITPRGDGNKIKFKEWTVIGQAVHKREDNWNQDIYDTAKKVYFKSYSDFYFVREKGNITEFRFFKENGCISWLGLKIPIIIKKW